MDRHLTRRFFGASYAHGDGGVVVFETWHIFLPELSVGGR